MQTKVEKAIALAFDPAAPDVPEVVATGSAGFARQILEIAFANGVKVREDADLVEILSTLEEGERIPVVAFAAVAEILCRVYRWEVKARQSEATPG